VILPCCFSFPTKIFRRTVVCVTVKMISRYDINVGRFVGRKTRGDFGIFSAKTRLDIIPDVFHEWDP